MPSHRLLSRTLAVPLLLALAGAGACGDDDDPTGPGGDPGRSGSIAFDFSGDRQGRFQATGELPDTATSFHGTWSTGAVSEGGDLLVVGARARTAPRVDLFFLALANGARTGTFAIDPFVGENIAALVFDLDALAEELNPEAVTYVLTSGSVTIQALGGGRVRGTLTGDAIHLEDSSRRLFIRNGTFDVPLTDDDFTIGTGLSSVPALR